MDTPKVDKGSNRTYLAAVAAAATLAVSIGWAPDAAAYGSREHSRFADQAYQILNLLSRGSHLPDVVARESNSAPPPLLTARPASVPAEEQASWNEFVAEALPAARRLDQLLIDLPDPRRTSAECGRLFPVVPPSPGLAAGQFGACRAEELSFAPAAQFASDASRCFLRRGYNFGDANAPELYRNVPTAFTGALLGYWAQNVDDLWDDTHLEVRPTNSAFVKFAQSLAEIGLETGLTLVIAPIYCVGDLLSGDFDCLDDARSTAHQVDPITMLDDISFLDRDGHGVGGFTTTGMWHFVSPRSNGQFNRRPGLHLVSGDNPFGPDLIDALAIVGADTLGATLNADRSDGVAHYAPFHDGPRTRRSDDWTSVTFAHLEFEPLDNLAQYGWAKFNAASADGRPASALGFPLHAIGDAVQPHHTISTLGWGHRPWETYAGLTWPDLFEKASAAQHYQDLTTVLGIAWKWWRTLKQSGDDVKGMIEAIADETLASPGARPGAIFKADLWPDQSNDDLRAMFADQNTNLKDLMMRGMGATLAFLVRASTRIAPSNTSSPCGCERNQARRGLDLAGTMLHSDVCLACGQGVFAQAPLWLDGSCVAYCPEDKPYAVDGACVASCPGSGCTSCPPDRHFNENGACVARCSATNPVVVRNASCAPACPADQTADARGYCANVVPQGGTCTMSMPGQAQGQGDTQCCVGPAEVCTKDTDCCSMMCGPDGLCLGRNGDTCSFPADCASNVCTNKHCAPSAGGRCASNADCLSGVCKPDSDNLTAGRCKLPLGTACTSAAECAAGICYGGLINRCCLAGGTTCTTGSGCCSGVCSAGKCTNPPIYVD